MPHAPKPLSSRIASKIAIDPVTDCHVWQGAHCSQGKYPIVGAGPGHTKPLYVHQYAAGPAPDCPPPDGSYRWEAHHWCLNRSCVNPDHISWLTHREHMAEHAFIRRASSASQVVV